MINVRGANFTIGALIKSVLFGDVGFGDSFMQGNITVEGDLAKWLEKNSGSRKLPYMPTTTRRVEAHYDIPAAFYEILLGESMSYTCANWVGVKSGLGCSSKLDRAQAVKTQRHIRWLTRNRLKSIEHHLDAGCGWGGFMNRYKGNWPDTEVHGLTLSVEQSRYISKNFPDQYDVFINDWREFMARGHYNTFSAIGMLEHVGKDSLFAFFDWVNCILKEEGVGVLQFCSRDTSISRWTDKHIFPGAEPPTFNEVSRNMKANGLEITDVIECGHDYVKTLECWLENFERNISAFKYLGFDDEFIRMFRLYLNGGICSFRTGATQLIQLRFEKSC